MKLNEFFELKKDFLTKDDFIIADKDIDVSCIKGELKISSLSAINDAEVGDLTFFTKSVVSGDKYIEPLQKTNASYVILQKKFEEIVPSNVIPIFSNEPHITFMALYSMLVREKDTKGESKIAPTAKIEKYTSIGEAVEIGENVVIEDFVKIGSGVKIGDGTIIKACATIGNNCIIGANCEIRENSTIKFAKLGDNCIVYSGARIGEEGFGFVFDKRVMRQSKINHYGLVNIGNRVEIGANSCIDRATFGETIIEDDVKIDNLVQIGHNVKIGSNSVLAGQTGIAGSAEIGKFCMLGGKSGMAGHIKLGNQCILYGSTNISKGFPDDTRIIGTPGEKYQDWIRNYTTLKKAIELFCEMKNKKPKGVFKVLKYKLFRKK